MPVNVREHRTRTDTRTHAGCDAMAVGGKRGWRGGRARHSFEHTSSISADGLEKVDMNDSALIVKRLYIFPCLSFTRSRVVWMGSSKIDIKRERKNGERNNLLMKEETTDPNDLKIIKRGDETRNMTTKHKLSSRAIRSQDTS